MTKTTLKEKMKKATAGSATSMVPVATPSRRVPPPPKEVEVVPAISELIADDEEQKMLQDLISQQVTINQQLKPLEKEKEQINSRIKAIFGASGISGKLRADGAEVNYYPVKRESLNQMKLIEAGVSVQTIKDCTDINETWQLKITAAKE